MNKEALDYGGFERDDVIGPPFWTTPWWSHDPDLQERLRDGLARCARTGEVVRFDARHPRVDGVMGIVDFSSSRIEDSENGDAVLLVEGIDVSEQRCLNEQLIQAQMMEGMGTLAAC